MSRNQRSEKLVAEIAERFDIWVKRYLRCNYTEVSKILDYANPTTLQSVKMKKTLPDFVRLAEHLDKLRDFKGRKMNLHWLICGEGNPVILNKNTKNNDDIIIDIESLDDIKKKAILIEISKILLT